MPELNQTEQEMLREVPESEWYALILTCGHTMHTRVRLRYEKPNRQYHCVRCNFCERDRLRGKLKAPPLSWTQVDKVEGRTNESLRKLRSGANYVLPRAIMRLDYGGGPNGNPFPYSSRDRDY